MHVPFTTEREAIRLIRDCMAKGIPLVFDDFPDSLRWAHKGRTDDDDPFMDPYDGVTTRPTVSLESIYTPLAHFNVCSYRSQRCNRLTDMPSVDAFMPTADKPSALTTSTLMDFKQSLKSPFVARYTSELMCGFPQDDHLTE